MTSAGRAAVLITVLLALLLGAGGPAAATDSGAAGTAADSVLVLATAPLVRWQDTARERL